MDFMNLLKGQLGGNFMQQLSQNIGSDDPQKTEKAANETLQTMVGAMGNTTANNEQQNSSMFSSLTSMLGGNMGNLSGMLGNLGMGGQENPNPKQELPPANEDAAKQIFGDQHQATVQKISQSSGLAPDMISKLMGYLAPIVMGFMGKNAAGNTEQKTTQENNNQGGMGLDDVGGFLKKLF